VLGLQQAPLLELVWLAPQQRRALTFSQICPGEQQLLAPQVSPPLLHMQGVPQSPEGIKFEAQQAPQEAWPAGQHMLPWQVPVHG
jgi:hypothetical protein